MTAEEAAPAFLGKGPWDLVLLLGAYPSEAWLLGKLLDVAVATARRRLRKDDRRLRRVVVRGPAGETLGSFDFEYDDDMG